MKIQNIISFHSEIFKQSLKIISEINELAGEFDELKFMEVCGTHTQTIVREFKFFMVGKIDLN